MVCGEGATASMSCTVVGWLGAGCCFVGSQHLDRSLVGSQHLDRSLEEELWSGNGDGSDNCPEAKLDETFREKTKLIKPRLFQIRFLHQPLRVF